MNDLSLVRGKKVYVGLSGGVDSGVSAALLQEAGAHVTGVFIKGWYPPGMPCTWSADRRDAMRVAAHLRIPFLTLDASKEYKEGVIDYLLREYKAGRTPNPDIMCNREVKFGAFANFALAEGADFIATGHYAQTSTDDHDKNDVHLLRGVDADKDQSYFLWAVPKTSLERTLFPVGGMPKSRVRELARKFALPNATKRDSQGICFLGTISVEDFLLQEFGSTPGDALDTEGAVIGAHNSALLHTLGERVHLTNAPQGPWYVVGKDSEKNTLTVSHTHESIGTQDITDISLLSTNFFIMPGETEPLTAQYRYHGPRIQGTFSGACFTPAAPLPEAIASGQSLVLYRDEECIGGGIIA
ncbi:MAG: tRNA-specific 2-thiouridylase MnmA [Parcubacteria group bacterium]|nr:tRNA-specific 2-thiouridylase MnmA [Parcubacteria group bacterium]